MLGVYDFCGHYEWTFAWLEKKGRAELVPVVRRAVVHRGSLLVDEQLAAPDRE